MAENDEVTDRSFDVLSSDDDFLSSIGNSFAALSADIGEATPSSRELSLARTSLEQAWLWFQQAYAQAS